MPECSIALSQLEGCCMRFPECWISSRFTASKDKSAEEVDLSFERICVNNRRLHCDGSRKLLWLLSRGHLGGLVGGALTAYLLGPNIEVFEGKGGKRQVRDNPPLPIFASKL